MARNRYAESLLVLANELALHAGSPNIRQAALRRAVSSAYYALFHALCTLRAAGLVGWGAQAELVTGVYRALDHGTARKRLLSSDAAKIAPTIGRLGTIFDELQQERHTADYTPPGRHFTRNRTVALIALACEAIDLLDDLDAMAGKRLAILLMVAKRSV